MQELSQRGGRTPTKQKSYLVDQQIFLRKWGPPPPSSESDATPSQPPRALAPTISPCGARESLPVSAGSEPEPGQKRETRGLTWERVPGRWDEGKNQNPQAPRLLVRRSPAGPGSQRDSRTPSPARHHGEAWGPVTPQLQPITGLIFPGTCRAPQMPSTG